VPKPREAIAAFIDLFNWGGPIWKLFAAVSTFVGVWVLALSQSAQSLAIWLLLALLFAVFAHHLKLWGRVQAFEKRQDALQVRLALLRRRGEIRVDLTGFVQEANGILMQIAILPKFRDAERKFRKRTDEDESSPLEVLAQVEAAKRAIGQQFTNWNTRVCAYVTAHLGQGYDIMFQTKWADLNPDLSQYEIDPELAASIIHRQKRLESFMEKLVG
jgi:hypothetical protein